MMNVVWGLLWPLTLAGSAATLVLLALTPLTRRLSARWNCCAWGLVLCFFVLPVALPVPVRSAAVFTAAPLVEWVTGSPDIAEMPILTPDAAFTLPWRELLAFLWLAGAVGFALWRLWQMLRFYRDLHRLSRPQTDPELCACFANCCTELGIVREIPLYVCEQISTPMLVGTIRPRILLPDAVIVPSELRLVFLHELTHLRRRDLWRKLAALAVGTLHWCNPLAWLISRRLNLLCELACDETLVRDMSHEQRRGYGMAILNVIGGTRFAPPVSTAFSIRKEQLQRRLLMIMESKKSTRLLVIVGICAAVLLLGTGVAASSLALAKPVAPAAPAATPLPTESPVDTAEQVVDALLSEARFDAQGARVHFTLPDSTRTLCVQNGWKVKAEVIVTAPDGTQKTPYFANPLERGLQSVGADLAENDCAYSVQVIDKNGGVLAGGSALWNPQDAVPLETAVKVRETVKVEMKLQTPTADGTISVGYLAYKGHNGTDFVAKLGDPVRAAADGVVLATEKDEHGYGNYVIIDHGGATQTLYGHCSKFTVEVGDAVTVGQKIAEAGRTGNATGVNVHFELRQNGKPIHSESYFK